jgi:hypothetical protein
MSSIHLSIMSAHWITKEFRLTYLSRSVVSPLLTFSSSLLFCLSSLSSSCFSSLSHSLHVWPLELPNAVPCLAQFNTCLFSKHLLAAVFLHIVQWCSPPVVLRIVNLSSFSFLLDLSRSLRGSYGKGGDDWEEPEDFRRPFPLGEDFCIFFCVGETFDDFPLLDDVSLRGFGGPFLPPFPLGPIARVLYKLIMIM